MPAELGPSGEVLASRAARLGAAILDTIIIVVIIVPMQWSMGMFDDPTANTLLTTAAWGAGGFLLYLLIQGYFLATRAQSVGKIALNIKIVTLDGQNADFKRIVLLRVLPITLVSMIPLIGSVLSLVDVLFIFRSDQRCVHDHLAGTRVVRA